MPRNGLYSRPCRGESNSIQDLLPYSSLPTVPILHILKGEKVFPVSHTYRLSGLALATILCLIPLVYSLGLDSNWTMYFLTVSLSRFDSLATAS